MLINPIRQELYNQLMKIEPSLDGNIQYRPSKVTLMDGGVIERVYVQEAVSYRELWGNWPDEDRGKKFILVESIQKIEESPVRLPACLANKMYAAGESAMGGCVFTLILKNGKRLPYMTGNAVDFLNFPPGVTSDMIKDLLPHLGREEFRDRRPKKYESGAEYFWCLYKNPQ